MNKIYIVKYSTGSYDDYMETSIFVTKSKNKARKYVSKFNKMLKKWQEHYKWVECDELGMPWISEEYSEKWFWRWHMLNSINKCFFHEIELR